MAKTKTSTKTKIAARPSAKAASRKSKSSNNAPSHKGELAGAKEVTIDRRRGARRDEEKSDAATLVAPPVKLERRQKVNRRRQIDPTTCERDYTEDEVEFMNALDEYKRKSGRMFPTCSEVLEVVRSLGYVRLSPTELAARTTGVEAETVIASVTIEEEIVTTSDWQ